MVSESPKAVIFFYNWRLPLSECEEGKKKKNSETFTHPLDQK